MKTPIDRSKKIVFRNARIRDYDKPRMALGYENCQLRKSNKQTKLIIRKKYPVKVNMEIKELLA